RKRNLEFLLSKTETCNRRHPWPIHPPPIVGESLESWIIRQAHANVYAPVAFLVTYFGKSNLLHLDFADQESEQFRMAVTILGFEEASRMTQKSFKLTLGGKNWRTAPCWITLPYRRYCPLCFAEDEAPYLRLIWRFTFVPICLKHKVILKSRCGSCGSAFRPYAPNSYYDLNKCCTCGYTLSKSFPQRVENADYVAISKLLRLAEGKTTIAIQQKFGVDELFQTLWSLIMLIKRAERIKTTNRFFPLADENIAPRFLTNAYTLLGNWPKNATCYIRKNQSIFNDLAKTICPEALREYRSRLHLPSFELMQGL